MGSDLPRLLRAATAAATVGLALAVAVVAQAPTVEEMQQAYARDVDLRCDVPAAGAARYAQLARAAFERAGIELHGSQYVIVVDRDPRVQVALLMWRPAVGPWRGVGASPVSTADTETPTGVFVHGSMDFRSNGTPGRDGIRRHGRKGMRVFDFGTRLRMHATDPDLLERRLGTALSQGSIRIPATLDALLDHYGVIDVERSPVLPGDGEPVGDPGRYLVVVDSGRVDRLGWAPVPCLPLRRGAPPASAGA